MNVIKELWHGSIIPQEDSRTNSKEMKDSFSCFSPNGQSFFFKCIDSLFCIRILLNKVAETLQTFIKKKKTPLDMILIL